MALTKSDIVQAIMDQIGFTKNQSSAVTEALLEIIKRTLDSGEDVLVSGFGKFCVNDKGQAKGPEPCHGGCHDVETEAGCYIQMLGEAEEEDQFKMNNKDTKSCTTLEHL